MGVSFALGCHGLTSRPLSEDEAASRGFALAAHDSGITADGGNMAFYYLLLREVLNNVSSSVRAMRLISVFSGVGTIPIVYCIGRRLANSRVGILASLLSAVSLPMVFWQQNARAYALGVLLTSASSLAFLVVVESGNRLACYGYFLLTVLACYTVFFAALVVVAQLLSLAAFEERDQLPLKRLLATFGTTFVFCLPLVALAVRRGTSQIAWIRRPGAVAIGHTILAVMSASAADGPRTTAPIATLLGWVSFALCLGVVAWGVFARSRPREARLLRPLAFCGLWIAVPPTVAFLFSQFAIHVYLDRYFTLCLPAVALLLALALDRLKPVSLGYVSFALLLGLRLWTIPSVYGVPVDGLQSAFGYLMTSTRRGDCITFSETQGPSTPGIATDLAYDHAHSLGDPPLPRAVLPPFKWSNARRASFVAGPAQQSFASVAGSCRRLWIGVEPGSTGQFFLMETEVIWFASHGWSVVSARDFSGLHLVLMRPRLSGSKTAVGLGK
ncbi:MAG: glycosyltransferase family 39 protein [Acidimicrobiales bacterium]